MHIKRKTIPQIWPLAKTGTKYPAVPSHNQEEAIPLIVAIRDMLKLVKSKKELKKLLNEKKILVNAKIVREVNYPLSLFDTLGLPSVKKFYRAGLLGKRMTLKEISEKESSVRIYKIIGKTLLKDKKIQFNLNNGKNLLSSEKLKVGDFLEIENINNKIEKIIVLKENTKVLVIKGKHIGKEGKIKEISKEGEHIVARIVCKEGEIKASVENLFALM